MGPSWVMCTYSWLKILNGPRLGNLELVLVGNYDDKVIGQSDGGLVGRSEKGYLLVHQTGPGSGDV